MKVSVSPAALIGCSISSSTSRVHGNASGLNVALPMYTVAPHTGTGGIFRVALAMLRLDAYRAAPCLHRERLLARPARGVQVEGENSQSVARGFGLASIGVPDPQAEVRRIGIFQGQDSVTSNTFLTITYPGDARGSQRKGQIIQIQYDVFIAEAVAFEVAVRHAPHTSETIHHVQAGADHGQPVSRDAIYDVESPAHGRGVASKLRPQFLVVEFAEL